MTAIQDKRELMIFGEGVFTERFTQGRKAVLFTAPEPLDLLESSQRSAFSDIRIVRSMDLPMVEETVASLSPELQVCVGFGGGSALDMAKYTAWKRDLPALLIPSILSVDACVTATAAVRVDGRVRYVGTIIPEAIYIDFAILRQAPGHLNAAGAADILSIHTALFDWQLAAHQTNEPFNAAIGEQARQLLDALNEHASDIRENSPRGLRFLAEAFAIEDNLCSQHGSSRPEEGSEHFLAYNLEYRSKRAFIHGELVGACIVAMAHFQENDPDLVVGLLDRLGIAYRAHHLNISRKLFKECLETLPAYCEHEGLPYSIINNLSGPRIDATFSTLWKHYLTGKETHGKRC